MDRKEATKKAIEIMQAYVDGADIEVYDYSLDSYREPTEEDFLMINRRFRIKPKPLECWVIFNSDGSIYTAHHEPFESDENFRVDGVHMREVTEK